MNEHSSEHGIRPRRHKWHSGQWRALAGVMTMVAALAVVWAVLASYRVWQREQDLENATLELNDLREDIQRLEEAQTSPRTTPPDLADDFVIPLDEEFDDDRDFIEAIEGRLGIITGEE